MLIELKKYNYIGNLDEIIYMLTEILTVDNPREINDIVKFCVRSTLFHNIPSKGILALLDFISAISFCDKGVSLNRFGEKLRYFAIYGTISVMIVEKILGKIIYEGIYEDFIDLHGINFDYFLEAYVIKNNEIPIKYSCIRNLLINLGFFSFSSNTRNLLVINGSYTVFLRNILKKTRSKLSITNFKQIQENNEKLGQEAEEFVLEYEKVRLSGHVHEKKIARISEIDVNAGYDIISYDTLDSVVIDRFIEVKSFSKDISFYWSKNEIEVSKGKGSQYYLYLIDRQYINQSGYQPLIIAHPFENVYMNNRWLREPQNFFFKMET